MKSRYLLALALLLQVNAFADPPEEGKILFMSRCAACHNVNKQLTGPALAGVDQRHSLDWIVSFVHSSTTVITSGDKSAVDLFEKFNKVRMPDHSDLSTNDIKNILAFIKSETKVVADEEPFARPSKQLTHYIPLSLEKDWLVFVAYIVIVILLIGALLFAVRTNEFKNKTE
jgi:cytochrome c2